jgi:A/G-specific adenine glycosylase
MTFPKSDIDETLINVTNLLSAWFEENKRELPWRAIKDPYLVLVSEMMLQQTRASVVIPYFEKWRALFPDVYALAASDITAVLKAWEGLGYYRRAKYLHKAAHIIVENHQGKIPSSREELRLLPGVGSYMEGAILAFGYNQKIPAVDGNVQRFISRLFSIESPIEKAVTQKDIRQLAEKMVKLSHSPITEALIEFGALICQKNPKCGECPFEDRCLAKKKGTELYLPHKTKHEKIEKIHRVMFVMISDGHVLVRRETEKLMQDLYHFYQYDLSPKDKRMDVVARQLQKWSFWISEHYPLQREFQFFTKYKATIEPHLLFFHEKISIDGYTWIPLEDINKYPFSSGSKKVLKQLYEDRSHGVFPGVGWTRNTYLGRE